MHSSSILKLLSFLSFMRDCRSFAIGSNEYLEPQDAASPSIIFSLAADGNNHGNLMATSEVGVMTDGINNQPGQQASAPPPTRAAEISASLMQLSEDGSNECTTHTNQFPNSRRQVRRGEWCRSNLSLPPDITEKDPNLPTAPTGQEVENGHGQRGIVEEEGNPSNGKKPSSSEQGPKPASQSAEKKVQPNKELCSDEGFKYPVCGPYLWAEQFGPPYRRRWDLEGCNPCTWFFTFPPLTHSTLFPKIDSSAVCKSGMGKDMRSRRRTWTNSLFPLDVSPCQKPDELWCCEQVFPVSLSDKKKKEGNFF